MLEAGAKGYLLKSTDAKEVVYAVNKVYKKQVYYCTASSNKIVDLFTRELPKSNGGRNKPLFSETEREIMRLICQEYCSKEIADILHTNQRSIDAARERIRAKIGCRNMAGVIIYAIRARIFSLD
jgi:DNA-binding NarL/FixJ family response regulator